MRRFLAFALTGAVAAAVHMAAVLVLVEGLAVAPLRANLAGFFLAFLCSYAGHRRLAFRDQAPAHRHALPRFLLVALAGLVLNQLLFAFLLLRLGLPWPLALVLVLVLVAALTFRLSRVWAFAPGR